VACTARRLLLLLLLLLLLRCCAARAQLDGVRTARANTRCTAPALTTDAVWHT
jgi:hypothetical protein